MGVHGGAGGGSNACGPGAHLGIVGFVFIKRAIGQRLCAISV